MVIFVYEGNFYYQGALIAEMLMDKGFETIYESMRAKTMKTFGSSSNSVLFYVLNPLILANSNFMFALLYICLLIAFNLLTVPSSTALFQE